MRMTIRLAAVAAAALVLIPGAASADDVYHSDHIALGAVGAQPLRSGFVENIHANGPVVFAMERYVLNGASPDTTYDVELHIWTTDATCLGDANLALPSVSFGTNVAGNGIGSIRFSPADANGLHGLTVGIVWTLSTGGAVAYETACTDVTLD